MKYVMTGLGPIIFPDSISHVAFSELGKFTDTLKIRSAGFVEGVVLSAATNVKTIGKSDSIKMKSNPDDARVVGAVLSNNTSLLNMYIAGMFEEPKPKRKK